MDGCWGETSMCWNKTSRVYSRNLKKKTIMKFTWKTPNLEKNYRREKNEKLQRKKSTM